MAKKTKIAVLISFSGQGGVERSFALLVNEIVASGIEVDLLLIKRKSPHLKALSPVVNQIPLKRQHSATCVSEVADYLLKETPKALLVAKHRAILAALKACKKAGTNTPITGVIGINVTQSLTHRSRLQRWHWRWLMRNEYPKLNGIIAVSEGVRDDLLKTTGMPDDRITAIKNPVTTADMIREAQTSVDHPWLLENFDEPVLITVGRLTKNKDHQTLLKAFSLINDAVPSRLLILGEGPKRAGLEKIIAETGLADRVQLPGFVETPWAWMAKCSLFVLSSFAEGSGNVLTEAMAVGTPVVSTDCPSGPSEMLDGGRIAPLVPVGDAKALAKACIDILTNGITSSSLDEAVAPFKAELAARHYLAFMNVSVPPSTD